MHKFTNSTINMCSFIPNQWLQTHAFTFHDRSLQKPWNTKYKLPYLIWRTARKRLYELTNCCKRRVYYISCESALTRRASSVLRVSRSDTVLACWMHLTIVRLWQWQPLTKISLIDSHVNWHFVDGAMLQCSMRHLCHRCVTNTPWNCMVSPGMTAVFCCLHPVCNDVMVYSFK
jgi:hypothetical protein